MDWIQLAITMLPAANINLLEWNQQNFSGIYFDVIHPVVLYEIYRLLTINKHKNFYYGIN
jgi:hypothetical protein